MENSYTIISDEAKIRLDKYIKIEGFTRSMIQNLITSGDILVNDKVVKVNHTLNVGDEITINIPELKTLFGTALPRRPHTRWYAASSRHQAHIDRGTR